MNINTDHLLQVEMNKPIPLPTSPLKGEEQLFLPPVGEGWMRLGLARAFPPFALAPSPSRGLRKGRCVAAGTPPAYPLRGWLGLGWVRAFPSFTFAPSLSRGGLGWGWV